MRNELDYLINLKNELAENNSVLIKKEILRKYFDLNNDLFTKFMDYIYSFDKKYWLTQANIEKFSASHTIPNKYEFTDDQNIFDVLKIIWNREITGHNAIIYILNLINFLGDKYCEIIYCILEKDLKVNINISLINKISPIVKEFNVALAERFDEAPDSRQVNFTDGTWMISRKLDGVRAIAIDNGEIEIFSRTGSVFNTLNNLKEDIKKILEKARELYNDEFVLDGEVCIIDEENKEDFAKIMKEITRKKHTISNPKYILFDFIRKNEFISKSGTELFKDRISKLINLNVEDFTKHISVVQHKLNATLNDFDEWNKISKELKWEGLILRKEDSVYSGKRTYDLQKVKSFFDNEYTVEDIEIGSKKMLIDGKMKEVDCVKSLLIRHKDTIVRVGSGIDDKERVEWYKNKEDIIGKIITVQYFEESIDSKTGELSLRFPTLKIVHGKKRET